MVKLLKPGARKRDRQSDALKLPATVCPEVSSMDAQLPPVPACSTVKVWPLTAITPLRERVVVFAATLKLTTPAPTQFAGVRLSQLAWLTAVHPHPVPVTTLKL